MKKLKRTIAAVLAAATVLTVPAGVSAEEYFFYYDGSDITFYIPPEQVTYVQDEEEEPVAEDDDIDWTWYFDFDYKEPEKFSTSLVPTFTAEAVSNGVKLKCDYVDGADYIKIYRYDSKKKKYVFLADSYSTIYTDTTAKSLTSYSYKIRMYTNSGKKTKLSEAVKIKTPLLPGNANVAVSSSKITVSWNKNSKADGYEIYYYKKKAGKKNFHTSYSAEGTIAYSESPSSLEKAEKQEFKKLKTTTETSYAIKRDKNYNYYFKIRAYKKEDGKKVYSDFSGVSATTSSASLFNGAKGKSKTTLPVISYRSDVSEWTMNISAADQRVIYDFMKEHFTSGMSDYDKAVYLADYIHYNVDYATAEGLNKISNMSCVQAAITNGTGQCYQYNGALAEFLAYMGYDVRLVCGYRESQLTGDRISHYWCEITLDGVKYVLDAGNKKDGLYNFCLPYECTNGYVVP